MLTMDQSKELLKGHSSCRKQPLLEKHQIRKGARLNICKVSLFLQSSVNSNQKPEDKGCQVTQAVKVSLLKLRAKKGRE